MSSLEMERLPRQTKMCQYSLKLYNLFLFGFFWGAKSSQWMDSSISLQLLLLFSWFTSSAEAERWARNSFSEEEQEEKHPLGIKDKTVVITRPWNLASESRITWGLNSWPFGINMQERCLELNSSLFIDPTVGHSVIRPFKSSKLACVVIIYNN